LIGRPAQTLALDDDSDRLPETVPIADLLTRESAAVRRARGQLAARQAQADVERAARVPDVT
jgi:outer membrane protein, heavy metal efflux system